MIRVEGRRLGGGIRNLHVFLPGAYNKDPTTCELGFYMTYGPLIF